jgi:hypothetical protein
MVYHIDSGLTDQATTLMQHMPPVTIVIIVAAFLLCRTLGRAFFPRTRR